MTVTGYETHNSVYIILHLSHLANVLFQSDLKEQLGISALLKGTSTDFSLSQLGSSEVLVTVAVAVVAFVP